MSDWRKYSCRFQAFSGACIGIVAALFCFVGWEAVCALPMPLAFSLMCLSEPNYPEPEAEAFWDEHAPLLRESMLLRPLTDEEAERACQDAPEVPMSDEEISEIVRRTTAP
jgi:hypothetical protein